jgi:crotonobetainyl-CoA:carnitine CoA-transferase CaiB-like acyl-CoA transferase
VEGFSWLRSDPSRSGRGHDELRLRSRSEAGIRHAADRATVWHAYHIAGEQLATGIIAALINRHRTGLGQDVSVAIHEAVSKNPELDIMHWVMRRVPLWRLTCRHALETPNASPSIVHTKDGRWFISHGMGARDLKNLVPLLEKYGMQADLQPPGPDVDLKARAVPGSTASDEARAHMLDVVQRFVRAWTYERHAVAEAQDAGLLWAPIRKPHENALDEHWLSAAALPTCSASGTWPIVPLSDQQVAGDQDQLEGRPAGAAGRRGYRNGPRRSRAAPVRAGAAEAV